MWIMPLRLIGYMLLGLNFSTIEWDSKQMYSVTIIKSNTVSVCIKQCNHRSTVLTIRVITFTIISILCESKGYKGI